MTVKGKTDTWTFTIDKDTTVTAKGATHKSLELKAEGKAQKLTEFVKVGDTVTVGYHDQGAKKHAATIRVTAARSSASGLALGGGTAPRFDDVPDGNYRNARRGEAGAGALRDRALGARNAWPDSRKRDAPRSAKLAGVASTVIPPAAFLNVRRHL